MKKKLVSSFMIFLLLFFNLTSISFANVQKDIVILFENDVHCNVEGYAKLSAMKEEIAKTDNYVGVVSSGDFIQGGNLGVVSKGEYIINIMNLVGYDAVAIGNHEFDYKIERLNKLINLLNAKTVCSNFKSVSENKEVFNPYVIVSYGDIDIAYIGVTTPSTLKSSAPSQFVNEKGEFIYNFSGDNLCDTVQKNIDAAKKDGAEYIIVLSHLGTEDVYEDWSTQNLIKNTSGIDVVLDGHSHSVIDNMIIKDKDGNAVQVSSTGTAFKYIGKLTISNGNIKTELIPTQSYEKTDKKIVDYLEKINEEYKKIGERVIGESEVELNALAEDGSETIRTAETNLGDLCADAYRIVTGADIGFINGGGIKDNIDIGEITFNEILAVYLFNNKTCVAEVTGQQIVDMLEFGLMNYPNANGSFQQVSGLIFDVDPQITSTIKLDDNQSFVAVEGQRRVSNVKVLNKETGKYEPINLEREYTLASHGHLLLEYGGGATMFKNAKVDDLGILDIELLEAYITENLGGIIGNEYAMPQNRINFMSEYVPLRKTFEGKKYEVVWEQTEPNKIVVNAKQGTMTFYAGSNTVNFGDKVFEADRVAYIEDGITYISADCVEFCEKYFSDIAS